MADSIETTNAADLVERLQQAGSGVLGGDIPEVELLDEAADTITRLKAALTEAREFIDAAGGFTPHREGADEMLRRIDAALSSVGGE